MNEYELNGFGKLRVWTDEDAPCVIGSGSDKNIELNYLCLEYYAPMGASFQYGLLGAAYLGRNVSDSSFDAPLACVGDAYYDNSLVGDLDNICIGLTDEFIGGITLPINAKMIQTSGIKRVSNAAYSNIGSSQFVFGLLMKTICESVLEDLCDDDISKRIMKNSRR